MGIPSHLRTLCVLCLLFCTYACRKSCDYVASPGVEVVPIYIQTNSIASGRPPIEFIPQSAQVISEMGLLGDPAFWRGEGDALYLPLDYRGNTLDFYVHSGDAQDTLRIRYDVQERWLGAECGMVTQFENLELRGHTFVDCRINDARLEIYYRPAN